MVNFYEHGASDMIKSLQLTVLFTGCELGATIALLVLATPVTLTLLCDVRVIATRELRSNLIFSLFNNSIRRI
jgi:hypothetical protein